MGKKEGKNPVILRHYWIIPLLLISFSVNAEWTKADQQRQLLFTAIHLADWGQTLDTVERDNFHENNPVLGKNPSRRKVNIFMASTLAGHWYIAKNISNRNRKSFQIISLAAKVLLVIHNRHIGLKVRF